MPYATRTLTQPVPRPPRRPRTPHRAACVVPAGTGMTVAQQLGGWAYALRVYVAFDGPYAADPAWLEVTEFVDQNQNVTITPGRADGLSDANATTCTLTVDNSDGRWTASNPSGAWYGQIRKGCHLRVDILPLSGVVSRRFTGYITSLPTTIAGHYAQAQISASDVFVLLTRAPKLHAMVAAEWLSDPVGAPYIAGYWPLHEPTKATYASDISGQAPSGAQALVVRSTGVSPGIGITWSNTPAPGPDQQSTVTFAPSGTPIVAVGGASNTGALPSGSYLQGAISLAASAQVTCWIKTTVAQQPIWSWSDPANNYAMGLDLTANGYLQLWQAPLSGTNLSYSGNFVSGPLSKVPLTDGVWHQISVKIQTPAVTSFIAVTVDGATVWNTYGASTPAAGWCAGPNMSRFLIGAAEGWNGDAATSGLALYTGSISDLVVHLMPTAAVNPNWYSPYVAAANGHTGELTGQRVARLVAYAGLPAPLAAFDLPGSGNVVYQPTTGTSTALAVGTTAHPCGPQALSGQNPLDALRTVARTEHMPLFVDAYGRITVQASTLRQNPSVAVTITAADLDPSTAWANDFQYVVNEASITPSGAGTVTVTTNGHASQALFGEYGTQISTVSLNALEAASLGAAVIGANSDPPPRAAPLAVEAATLAQQAGYGPAWYDAVLALTISSIVQVTGWQQQTPYGSGGTSTHVIEGWTETISAGTHLIAWVTSPPQGPSYQCDSPTLGVIDTPGITLAY